MPVAEDAGTDANGWTAHEVTAHLAAAVAEVTRHLLRYLAGDLVPQTRTFEEREPPYRALSDADLLRRLEVEEERARSVIAQALARDPDAVIPWTGRRMVVAKFLPHLRNEFAVHRWDFVGDDDISTELLAQSDLTEHAVGVLGQILLRRGRAHDPTPDEDFTSAYAPRTLPTCVSSLKPARQAYTGPRTKTTNHMSSSTRPPVPWSSGAAGSTSEDDSAATLRNPSLNRLQALLSGY
ncbi:MAG: maleylpyruvate isomerase N-terminal domain-containing protein [Pseudonocardiaceae bacterium]